MYEIGSFDEDNSPKVFMSIITLLKLMKDVREHGAMADFIELNAFRVLTEGNY